MSADQGGPAVAELEDEVGRLRKINAALIERAESYDESPGSDFGIFRSTVLLEDQIRSRTRALDLALRRLEDANSALRQSQAQLQAIFDVVPNPLAVALPDTGTFVGVSHSFAEFFGLAPEAMIGRGAGIDDLDVWPSEEDRARFTAALDSGGGRVSGFPLTVPLPSGSTMHLQLSGRLLDVDGRRLLLVEFHDVTAATHDVHRLRNLAEHDPLTGLPNRLLLLDRLACARFEAEASGGRVAVCYADLDGFKHVNDHGGHLLGDGVLTEIGRRLLDAVRGSDTVGRIGGDEFALVLPDVSGAPECEAILERALVAVAAPLDEVGYEGAISASIGYTVFPDDGASPESLLHHADRALYEAKLAGKNRFARYAG
jgi:diguanylate cyclase (GGDEF)-like protein/PAS domain S-box-containing protein